MDILVVDDNTFILQTIRHILGDDHYNIHTCGNVDEALSHIDSHPYDLVITDIILPERSGVDLICEMKRRGLATPILAITGGAENSLEDHVSYADLYADETLQKPFRHRDLLATVERLAARAPHP